MVSFTPVGKNKCCVGSIVEWKNEHVYICKAKNVPSLSGCYQRKINYMFHEKNGGLIFNRLFKNIYLFGGAESSFLRAFLLYREVSGGYSLVPVCGLLVAAASLVEPWALGQGSIVVVHGL